MRRTHDGRGRWSNTGRSASTLEHCHSSSRNCPIGVWNRLSSDTIRFGSLLVYRPGRPTARDTDATKQAWAVMMAIKSSKPPTIAGFAGYLRRRLNEGVFTAFFGSDVVLVPAPGHAPAPDTTPQSSTGELVRAMAQQGLGREATWLLRQTKVAKSAWAGPGERPTTHEHYDSVVVPEDQQLSWPSVRRITIVDDVITTGATLHACARRLREAFPFASVLAFAAIRTMSGTNQIEHPIDPIEDGEISLRSDQKTERSP